MIFMLKAFVQHKNKGKARRGFGKKRQFIILPIALIILPFAWIPVSRPLYLCNI